MHLAYRRSLGSFRVRVYVGGSASDCGWRPFAEDTDDEQGLAARGGPGGTLRGSGSGKGRVAAAAAGSLGAIVAAVGVDAWTEGPGISPRSAVQECDRRHTATSTGTARATTVDPTMRSSHCRSLLATEPKEISTVSVGSDSACAAGACPLTLCCGRLLAGGRALRTSSSDRNSSGEKLFCTSSFRF